MYAANVYQSGTSYTCILNRVSLAVHNIAIKVLQTFMQFHPSLVQHCPWYSSAHLRCACAKVAHTGSHVALCV